MQQRGVTDNPNTKSQRELRLALLLAGLAMLGPFAVDTYLPAFPNIAATLHATQSSDEPPPHAESQH